MTSAVLALRLWVARRAAALTTDLLAGFIEKDAAPSFVADEDGAILTRNAAAADRFSDSGDATLAATLRSVFANPQAVLYRLQCRSRIGGNAREDVITRRGHVRLAVHRLGDNGYLWRVEDVPDRSGGPRGAEVFAVPMITVGRSGALLFMNDAARQLIGTREKSLDHVFPDQPVRPGEINRLNTSEGPVDVIVAERDGQAGRRELYFLAVTTQTATPPEAFETLPVPMIKLEPGGKILKVNRLAGDLLGVEITTDTVLSDLMQGLGRPVTDWLRDTALGVAHQKSEFLRLTRPDKEVFVQVSLSRVSEDGGTVLIALLNDATELKSLEAQFVQSQKMQAIGQLAGGIAHDFNNLLTAISGHCDLLLLRHDQGDQNYGDLVQINQNANRAAALVSQLLAFSRKQTLRPEVLDLRDTLSDLTHLLNRLVGEKVTLTLSHDPVLRPIRADKRQLEQVLMNLVVNARDAMPQGGEIRIETEVLTLETPLTRDRATVPPGDYVTVKVSDKGTGISPDKLQKVFEPFYTTKRTGEGTGLGLSTAYGIIKQTGGFIFVDSVPGEGTEFTLFFPAFEPEASDIVVKPVATPSPVPQHGEGVVLLVEDEAPVRAFASRALRLRGYTVLEADSAEDALRLLEDPDLTVDVFVTDVVMPGMDGPSWVRLALKDRPLVRVVFVSGYAEGAFGETGPSVPNSVFLPKPFSLNQLTETVHQQLH
ncbi:response regulator [Seohaeicola saemankumensis]|nr:ATP-binding protein [Seohaeicola saemankumensis]MCA0873728.1 response regulator [Seohaeicola saemankumensis]